MIGKEILILGSDPAIGEEFRRIVRAGGMETPQGSGKTAGLPLFEGMTLESVDDPATACRRIQRAAENSRPYLLALIDLDYLHQSREIEEDAEEIVQRVLKSDGAIAVFCCTSSPDVSSAANAVAGDSPRRVLLSRPLHQRQVRPMVAWLVERHLVRAELERHARQLELARREIERMRKEVEAAERGKCELTANLSHEIRTPLHAILGFSRLLLKEPLDDGGRDKARMIHDAGESLLKTINNVLSFSELSTGQSELEEADFVLDEVLGEALDAARRIACDKGLAVRCRIEESTPRYLRGDRRRFAEILVNLLSNALKFTERGMIHLQATFDERTDASVTLRLAVTDTGVGIPADRQAIIFESFAQGDGSTTRQHGGVGLGLTVCKRMVDMMGGQIGFRSDVGQGSSFWLTLPFGVQPDTPSKESPSTQESVGRVLTDHSGWEPANGSARLQSETYRVMVAEDDRLNRTLIELLLGRAGCIVDLAGNGREALAALQKDHYDLLLTDIDMPEMDGLELIQRMRRLEAVTGGHLPMIALTAHAQTEDRRQCRQAGADEFVTKPFTHESLFEAILRQIPGFLEGPSPESGDGASAATTASADSLANSVDDLRRAIDRKDFRAVENLAHALRQRATEDGAKTIADHALRVELGARVADPDRIAAASKQLQQALQERPIPAPKCKTARSIT